MTVQINNTKQTVLHVTPQWTGTVTPYQMAYLSHDQKRVLGLPRSIEYAVRIDGPTSVALVKITNGYTGYKYSATIIAE